MRWTSVNTVILLLSAAIAVACHVHATEPQPTYKLAYKFRSNQFAHYEVASRMTVKTTFDRAEETAVNESLAQKSFRVVSVDPSGNATLEPEISRLRMQAVFGQNDSVVFDSESADPVPEPLREMASSVGAPVCRLQVGPLGQLLGVTPLVGKKTGSETSKTDPRQNMLITLPSEPIAIGTTWKDRIQLPVVVEGTLQREFTLQRSYKLISVQGSRATIEFRTASLTPIEDPSIEVQLVQRLPFGTIEFDIEQGLVVAQTLKTEGTVVNAFGPKTQVVASSVTIERLMASPTERGIAVLPPETLRK